MSASAEIPIYAKPRRKDKTFQINIPAPEYDDVILPGQIDQSLITELYAGGDEHNNKAIQVNPSECFFTNENDDYVNVALSDRSSYLPQPMKRVQPVERKQCDGAESHIHSPHSPHLQSGSPTSSSTSSSSQGRHHNVDDLDKITNPRDREAERMHRKSIASLSELDEVTMVIETAIEYTDSDDKDWDTKSGISI